ncbi:MAG: ABC transporter permease [Bacteroidia bacterium]|nr:ABC transporter permease [Bacteroidia bacterium]
MSEISPPRWLLRFFRWYCHPDFAEDIEGDLCERFARNAAETSLRKARWRFLFEVLLLFRPGIIRPVKLPQTLIYPSMFRHNLLITYRSFLRNKSSFLINLIGLTSGLTCTLLIYLWVSDELSMDKFHEKDSRLYQVFENILSQEGNPINRTLFETSGPMADLLKDEMPGVEYATAVGPVFWSGFDSFTLSVGEKKLKAAGQYAGKDFFNIFSYELTQGEKNQVLADKNSIVLSEALATALFQTTDGIVGKPVTFQHEREFIISGLFKGTPDQSSSQFDFVLSFETLKEGRPWVNDWGSTGPHVFAVLKEGVSVSAFNDNLNAFLKARYGENITRNPFLYPYSDIYLKGTFENGKPAGGRIAYIRLFSIIAVFILLIACINFMNLSTAKASRRMTEIGIKKVVGSGRKALIFQYIGESTMMALLSLLLAMVIVLLFLPQFNQITGKHLSLDFDIKLIVTALVITFLSGIVAGSYPALYLSGFAPIRILKGRLNPSSGEVWARKGLVVFQFAVSIILIVSVGVVYKQIEFVQHQNLGYDKENVIWFNVNGKLTGNTDSFLAEAQKIPGVVKAAATSHSMVGHNWSTQGIEWDGRDAKDQTAFQIVGVDYDFFKTLSFEMKEGRPFSREYGTDGEKIIFNEAAIKIMGLKDPLGKTVHVLGKDKEIIGVAKDFHFESFHEAVKPLFFILLPNDLTKIMVKIEAGREKETLSGLADFYGAFNPGFDFDYHFLDETYQAQYVAEQRVSKLSRYFAGLAILISCLGLFGLAAFTAERRIKEIGIRKILGASAWSIVRLLSADFTKMVLAAIVIALPVSYLIARQWLEGFAYRIDLEWWFFVGAAVAALLIAWLTVGVQTLRAAAINPAQCLRDE